MSAAGTEGVPAPAGYRAPAAPSRAELRERGSRFLAVVQAAPSEEVAHGLRAELLLAYPDATHHCWAQRIGAPARERSADAGEPAGTAGLPILQVLRGAGLSDVLAVVVRWFGGTKLGKGGLARTYRAVVQEALLGLVTVERAPAVRLTVELPYDRVGAVKRLVRPPAVELGAETYGEHVKLSLIVRVAERAVLDEALADLGLAAREE